MLPGPTGLLTWGFGLERAKGIEPSRPARKVGGARRSSGLMSGAAGRCAELPRSDRGYLTMALVYGPYVARGRGMLYGGQ